MAGTVRQGLEMSAGGSLRAGTPPAVTSPRCRVQSAREADRLVLMSVYRFLDL